MSSPTLSPDGKWMWDGNSWIPAPPQSNIMPQTEINQNASSVNNNNLTGNLQVRILKKGGGILSSKKIIVEFIDPLKGVKEIITFSAFSRTYTAKLSNKTVVGKLPLKGMAITSGAEGMISLPNGHTYNVILITGLTGPTGLTITDWNDGRKCMDTC